MNNGFVNYFKLIKFSHTVFAMPFALIGFFLGLQSIVPGTEVQGMIRKIQKDSLYINIYDERPAYTMWGTSFWDTVSVGLSRYHIKEVREIFKPRENFSFIKNGLSFMMGGSAYAILHSVNALYLKQPIIPSTMAISGAVALTGFALSRIHKKTVTLGNKYYLQYIPVTK